MGSEDADIRSYMHAHVYTHACIYAMHYYFITTCLYVAYDEMIFEPEELEWRDQFKTDCVQLSMLLC